MALDLDRIMILMQRRYNFISEINKLTGEIGEAVSRNDHVTVTMLLEMRADEMAKVDECSQEIWDMAGAGIQEEMTVRRLMTCDLSNTPKPESPEEKKIYEIRLKTRDLLDHVRKEDRRISQRAVGRKSYYAAVAKE